MTTFLRLLTDKDKASNLLTSCTMLRTGTSDTRIFEVAPESFQVLPGAPFAYWVSNEVRQIFEKISPFDSKERTARQGLATADDFRFVRLSWEIPSNSKDWWGFAKGGAFSRYYSDVYLMVNWAENGAIMKAWADPLYGNSGWSRILKSTDYYARPGLTWPRRTQQFGVRVMPRGCVFADKGPAAFISDDNPVELLALLALMTSRAFESLVELSLNAGDRTARSYEVGIIQNTPIPDLSVDQQAMLTSLACRAWSLKRTLDTIEETSHAFLLPATLRACLGDYKPLAIEEELACIQIEIDTIAFDLYGFSEADRIAVQISQNVISQGSTEESSDERDDEDILSAIDHTAGLLSWAVGVAFGRFDLRLATGERQATPEPEPFDPLPEKSPGMLPNDAKPFHCHGGILVDDPGHRHDLPHLIEEVLNRVIVPVPDNVRRWLQKDFFTFHLKLYSKSRRKAPIYWPLSTASGSYTLWIYYPSWTSQTLFTAVNDFLDGPNGKLTQVSRECAELRQKGSSRSSEDEKRYEMLQTFEQELTDFRDTLLKIALTYQPNHDDGVQITAAPLWPLFRHKPWQKLLKDTWTKLEKGDYDWAHLAMNYWPERVREKCKTDKSLAIAHGLESIYVEPEVAPKKTRSKKKAETDK